MPLIEFQLFQSRAVKLSLSKNNLILKVNSHDTGNASEELEVNFDGSPMEIGFNSKYLLDIALQMQGKEMQFLLSDSSSPALITDPEVAKQHVIKMVKNQTLNCFSGKQIPCDIDSVCVHGDGKSAVRTAVEIKDGLIKKGVTLRPLNQLKKFV